MGLRLITDERLAELENELQSFKIGYRKMIKEHDAVLKSYRDLRDSKDEEIANLHSEIEALKQDKEKLRRENGRLRQAVNFYEKRHKMEVLDEKEV